MMLTRRNLLKYAILSGLGSRLATAPSYGSPSEKTSVFFISMPSVKDNYYKPYFTAFIQFVQNFISVIHEKDSLQVVVDYQTQLKLKNVIPKPYLLSGKIPDIWMRDFSPIQTKAGLFKFRYRPNYLKPSDAKYIEQKYMRWFKSLGLAYQPVDLFLDGGNFNYNGEDSGLTTSRVFADNQDKTPTAIISLLKETLGLKHLAILPEVPGDTTGHSDGMVKWLNPYKLAVSEFDHSLAKEVMAAIRNDLKAVEVVPMPYQPSSGYWKGFADATGVYVNAMTTENAIYVPQFGKSADQRAIRIFKQHTTKEVIPVSVGRVGEMGGSVRCLTWQLTGQAATAFTD